MENEFPFLATIEAEDIPYVSKHQNPQSKIIFSQRSMQVRELHDLCLNTKYKDKLLLFYKSLLYYDIISFQSDKNPKIGFNNDLIVLNSFYLGIKFTQNQINIPVISQLTHSNKKYSSINSNSFLINEMLCLQLLNFKLVYSSPYDYLLMFVYDKPLLFEKGNEYLEKIIYSQIYLNYSPYIIASALIAYVLHSQGVMDFILMKKFWKKDANYHSIVKAINSSGTVYSDSSTTSSEGSPQNNVKEMIASSSKSHKDVVNDKYKKIRQMSKNIELSQANHLFQMNMSLHITKEKEKEETEEKKSAKRCLLSNEPTKKSCINIFSSSNKNGPDRNGGTISLMNSNSPLYNNLLYQKESLIQNYATNKAQCKVNIDFHSLSKLSLNSTCIKNSKTMK